MVTKFKFTTYISLSLFFCYSQTTYALKYTIFTDQPDTSKAKEVIDEMKKTYPFSVFKIEFEIITVPAQKLACESKNGIDRLVMCDNTYDLTLEAAKRGSDQVMVVKNMDKWGGSAAQGGIPVITTSTSARAMIHEYMHVLGACDEYQYEENEAQIYCRENINTPNAVAISPLADGYSGDSHAKSVHQREIPWFKQIKNETPITQNTGSVLGTGTVDYSKTTTPNYSDQPLALSEPIGLYRGKICNKANPVIPVWHPGGSANIMENMNAGLGPTLENFIIASLKAKGVKRKLSFQNNEEENQMSQNGKPDIEVNNTGRNVYKSFFDWLSNLFQNGSISAPK